MVRQGLLDTVLAQVLEAKSAADCRHDIIADLMRVALRTDFAAGLWIPKPGLHAPQYHGWVHGRNDDPAVGLADAGHLSKELIDICQMLDDKRTDDPIERLIIKGKPLSQIAGLIRDVQPCLFRASPFEHFLRKINGMNVCAGFGHAQGMPPCAATQVNYFQLSDVAK